jgi:hypothetical protein
MRIPFEIPERTITGQGGAAPINPGLAGLPFQRGAQVADEIGESRGVRELSVFDLRRKEAQDEVEVANVRAQVYRDQAALKDRLEWATNPDTGELETDEQGNKIRRTDWQGVIPEAEQFQEKSLNKYMGMVSPDNRRWTTIKPFIEEHFAHNLVSAKEVSWRIQSRKMNEDYLTTAQTYKENYTTTGDQRFIQEFKQITSDMVARGVITPEQGQARIHDIAVGGDLQRIYRTVETDPIGWIGTPHKVDDLKANYPNLTDADFGKANSHAMEQARMAHTMASYKREADKQAYEDNRKKIRAGLQENVENGNIDESWTAARAYRSQGALDDTDIDWFKREVKSYQEGMQKTVKEEDNDQIRRIYNLIDANKFNEARELANRTPMKPETHKGILSEIRSIRNHYEDKATSEQKYIHSQAKGDLMRSLGIIEGTIMEDLDPITKEVVDMAGREFTTRSIATGGKENPLDVSRDLSDRYQKTLFQRHSLAAKDYEGMLLYKTPQELEEALKSKTITPAFYGSQVELFKRLYGANKKAQEAKGKVEAKKGSINPITMK